jgi:hypothetical protein
LTVLSRCGWYTVPRLVGRKSKGRSRFEGRVVKLTVAMTAAEIRELKPHVENYARHLARAGIETGNPSFFILHGRNRQCRLGYVHDHFSPSELLPRHLEDCPEDQVFRLFASVKSMSDQVLHYSRQQGIGLGLDLRPKNLAVRGDRLVYLDLLPAFVDEPSAPDQRYWLRLLRRARWRLSARCAPAIGILILRLLVAKRMVPQKRMRLVIQGFLAARPTLASELRRIHRDAPATP